MDEKAIIVALIAALYVSIVWEIRKGRAENESIRAELLKLRELISATTLATAVAAAITATQNALREKQ